MQIKKMDKYYLNESCEHKNDYRTSLYYNL